MREAIGEVRGESAGRGRRIAQRTGFWLGLVLFVALLSAPPTEGMVQAARQSLAGGPSANRAGSAGQDEPTADAELTERRTLDDQAAYLRARTMMAAAAVTALVACWWISTAVPIPVTSLLPLLLFPILGVMPIRDAASPYADPNVFLFMGGFIIALGIQRWDLHRHIALRIVSVIGTGRSTLVLGFMLASAGLSMWISNTATTMMMLPIGLAVIASLANLDSSTADRPAGNSNFAVALMLGIAYAANVGGIATPIGTPPNIVFRGQLEHLYPDAPEVGFGQWMLLFVPFVAIFVPAIWLVLTRVTCRIEPADGSLGRAMVRRHLTALGPLSRPARMMLLIFAATALLWITRSIPVSKHTNYGWANLVEHILTRDGTDASRFRAANIDDATIALGMAVLLFIIPAGRDPTGEPQRLMNWETARQLPWGILLLFGGGFAIAAGFQSSGLSLWCGQLFIQGGLQDPLWLIAGTCLAITFLTEITSNTATTQIMLPVLAHAGSVLGLNPMALMLSATVSASCAFMLPVATPPNAIVFGSGQVPMGRMVRTGFILNLIGVVLMTATLYLVARPLMGLDPAIQPDWVP